MECASLKTIVKKAVRTGDYHVAQVEVAMLLLTGRLCQEHERTANKLVNTSVDPAPLFAEALEELQFVERLR